MAIGEVVDPTGVGDAFRAGYLAGLAWGVSAQRSAQVGSMLAALVIETTGTQEYSLERGAFLGRIEAAYGGEAAQEIGSHLPSTIV